MESGIYSILNIINNKRYIGQSQDISLRWTKHKQALNNKKHENKRLQNAWNKYGEGSFVFSILELCPVELLNQQEVYWISYYNSMENGYNLCEGGNGIRGYKHTQKEIEKMIQIQKPKSVLQLDLELNIVCKFASASQAAKSGYGQARTIKTICERKNHQKTLCGYIWVYEEDYLANNIDWDYYLNNNKTQRKPIKQYDYLGRHVKTWDSIYQIVKELGYSATSIINVAKGKRKNEHAYGFYWKYDDGNKIQITVDYYEQYTLDGVFVCSFRSIKEFAKSNNLSESSIQKCISGKLKSNFGFKYNKITKTYILN